jgi:hypothetical protein
MNASIRFRVGKLSRISARYRQLAFNLYPNPVSEEITAVADELHNEAARLKREWRLRKLLLTSKSSWLDSLRRER